MRPPVSRAAFASVLLGRRAVGASLVAARCASSAASPAAAVTAYDHASFVKEIAATDPPEHLNSLLNVLQARGEKIVSPGAKRGLIPVVVPLSESPAGNLTSLLRWPTAPTGMEMPVVEVAGENLYTKGDFKESQLADLDVYLLKKVGLFPDVIERKTLRHLEKGDNVSALITGEFYSRDQFPGFGRPFVFNAEILKRVGRTSEAKDSARVALKSPWWTLGCSYEEAAELAGWEDEQIEFIREKVTEEGKREDLKKGKAPEQVVLDEAAFLMDLACVDGNWDDVVDRIAECYREAGLDDVAKFIAYRE
ncbi:protein IN CHLOROPLAST ATPASE BIOGENESIS, chloroplastic isoform X2 [Setaria viridis]|uniref:protein IN CHLOROPLAST ATPASE BIOGENESIS, chloroplastic isoform X2 n=1 Tax=Setaria viridis TaxID=4556 RepID=UPI000646AE6B|nr:protein IN CHLOROPLAST ATPASE BIOGENESIS, chloroplastic-like isoform X2 [Setaria viridis]